MADIESGSNIVDLQHVFCTFNDWLLLYMCLSIGILDFRERPFNLKGGYGFFLKKYSDSQCCWKKYSDFGGGKKK